jgi:hypothetical protein
MLMTTTIIIIIIIIIIVVVVIVVPIIHIIVILFLLLLLIIIFVLLPLPRVGSHLELSFMSVLALPKDSRSGLVDSTFFSRSPVVRCGPGCDSPCSWGTGNDRTAGQAGHDVSPVAGAADSDRAPCPGARSHHGS